MRPVGHAQELFRGRYLDLGAIVVVAVVDADRRIVSEMPLFGAPRRAGAQRHGIAIQRADDFRHRGLLLRQHQRALPSLAHGNPPPAEAIYSEHGDQVFPDCVHDTVGTYAQATVVTPDECL
jgi:hypothetical protein